MFTTPLSLVRAAALCMLVNAFSFTLFAQNEPFSSRVLTTGLNSAWELTYGPNDSLWYTESKAYKISRIDIATKQKTVLLHLLTGTGNDPSINFSNGGTYGRSAPTLWPQGGLMGMAIHPNLYSANPAVRAAKPWVYIVYVYKTGSCPNNATSCIFTTKIVRYTYSNDQLINPQIVLDNIPGSSDHNSGRLVIGPTIEPGSDAAHTQYRLYYTVGDMGAGQLANVTRINNAQNIDVMEGKVLRINTEEDGDAGADTWVPNDNPFYESTSITARDYVYSYGHRNAQGLVWGKVNGTNILYSSEQSDKSDDELNIIEKGQNYGWDKVAGYCDGNWNGNYKLGQTTPINEQAFCNSHSDYKDPIFTMFTATATQVATMPISNSQWPTVACSGLDFYGSGMIPGWSNSLLVPALKAGAVFRIKLNSNGDGSSPRGRVAPGQVQDTITYFKADGDRIRDVAISPNGLKIYVARDQGAFANAGSIMEYTYEGITLGMEEEKTPTRPGTVNNIISIYPNPTPDKINIQAKRNMQLPLRVQLIDLNGKLLKEIKTNNPACILDVSTYKQGIYILKLYNGVGAVMATQKIIKL